MSVDEFGRTRVETADEPMDFGPNYDSYEPNYDRDGYNPGPRSERYETEHYRADRERDIIDPNKVDYIVSFRQYADWLRMQGKIEERPRPTDFDSKQRYEEQTMRVRKLYDEYKRGFQGRLNRLFFDCHKDEEWMLERYHPAHMPTRKHRIADMKQHNYARFMDDLDAGRYDTVNHDEPVDEPNVEDYSDPDFVHRRDQLQRTVFIKTIPVNYKRDDVEKHLRDLPGFEYLAISEPRWSTPERGIPIEAKAPTLQALASCVGWAVFDSPSSAQQAQATLLAQREQATKPAGGPDMATGASNGGGGGTAEASGLQYLATGYSDTMTPPRLRTTTIVQFCLPEAMAADLDKVRQLAQKLDEEAQITNGAANIEARAGIAQQERAQQKQVKQESGDTDVVMNGTENNNGSSEHESTRIALDMFVIYLRRVHMYCFYSGGVEADSFEELTRRCGDKMYRRRPKDDVPEESRDSHQVELIRKRLYEKIDQRFNGVTNDQELSMLGGYVGDEYVDAFLQQFVERESESRYRCDYEQCKKLFKDDVYVFKHLKNKHPELVPVLDEKRLYSQYINNYVSDPHHIVPKEAPAQVLAPAMMPGMMGREPMYGYGYGAGLPIAGMGAYAGGGMGTSFRGAAGGGGGRFPSNRSGGRFNPYGRSSGGMGGPPPRGRENTMPEDPRARNIRAYDDLDAPKEKDVQLMYD
ncbi:hypothetical protein RI367_002765 [Sorochytrium milnesiophthora]